MLNNKPERSCIVCKTKGDKSLFYKFVMNKAGEIQIEGDNKLPGRGAYVCKDNDCLQTCIKKRLLNRAFKTNIPQNFYEGIAKSYGIK